MATFVQSTSAVVVAQALHLREGPGARYPIRAMYSRGIAVRVLGRDRSAEWLRVVTPDERAGWMAAVALALRVPLDDLQIVDGGPPPGEGAGQDRPPAGGGALAAPGSRAPSDSGIAASAADVPAISDTPKGLAIVGVEQTMLHTAAGTRSEGVQVLRKDEQVKLLGQARGAWVRVQPFTAVVPGWVYAADLRPLPGTIGGAPAITGTATRSVTPPLVATPALTRTADVAATSITGRLVGVLEAEPVAGGSATVGLPQARTPVAIAVAVVEAPAAAERRGRATPMAVDSGGLAGVRVQIVSVFGDVLVEALTPASGRVRFTRDVPPATALYVQLPTLGLRAPVPPDAVAAGDAAVTVLVPARRATAGTGAGR